MEFIVLVLSIGFIVAVVFWASSLLARHRTSLFLWSAALLALGFALYESLGVLELQ